jgi:hypothetical protein
MLTTECVAAAVYLFTPMVIVGVCRLPVALHGVHRVHILREGRVYLCVRIFHFLI